MQRGRRYVGGNQTNSYYTIYQDSEREFVVTHYANIKPVSYFTGREEELGELRRRIEGGRKSVLVSGMGGIGKTHICRKLFEEYTDREKTGLFRHIGYIAYDGDMDSSLQRCLKFKRQAQPEKNREAAWRELEYLASGGRLLLFVDNVNVSTGEDPSLKRLLSIPGAIVLTSRRSTFSREFEPYRIGFLSTGKCREIYEKIRFENSGKSVAREEVPDLEYIIDRLAARHTITIEFLAHLAWNRQWSVQKLRKELEENGFRLEYRDEEDRLVNIQKSYETLYDMSALTEAERNVLEAFSVFPYIPLAAGVCERWLSADAGVREGEQVLMGLYRKGWLQFDVELESYALHPVFARIIYEKCKPESGKHAGLVEACQKSLEIAESGSLSECRKYLPFAESIIERLDIEEDLEKADVLSDVAYLLDYTVEYQKAEDFYKQSLRIRQRMQGEEHPCTVTNYNNLAGVYGSQGEYKKAEELYERSLRIRERVLGEEHPDTARSYNNLAFVYEKQGKYKKAEELYEKSLRIRERVLGDEHPDTAGSYNNLASVYESQGEYKKAEELYEKSLRIRERVLGEGHLVTATSYNNLAGVYRSQGKYKKAEELYEKSLRIRERVLGEEHPDTARSYNNLAGVYKSQGEYRKAEELYEKSLRIRERLLREEHPDTATSYNNLAGIYLVRREYQAALSYYVKAYRIYINKFGNGHPHTRIIFENIERAYAEWKPNGNFSQWLEEKMDQWQAERKNP